MEIVLAFYKRLKTKKPQIHEKFIRVFVAIFLTACNYPFSKRSATLLQFTTFQNASK
jgi:hypothetical protein